jgi:centrosomal protein CEP104
VQFPHLVKLKQLQFLSHQSKVASKIELFTFLPSGPQALTSQIPLNEIEFKRLGYLSLDPNERSGFQARELKSVYVDSDAVLLKLIFHKCHLNNFNVFNQIGLIALNCMGEAISMSR